MSKNTSTKPPWDDPNVPSSKPSESIKSPSGCRISICSWYLRSSSIPSWENCITSMYIATHVTALYSACTSAFRRRAACFSFSPSRGANLLGSGKGSNHHQSASDGRKETNRKDALCGTLFTNSYISSAHRVITWVFCASCSSPPNNTSSTGSISPLPVPPML